MNLGILQKNTDTSTNEVLHFSQNTVKSDFVIASVHSTEEDNNLIKFEAERLRIPNLVIHEWNVGNVETVSVASPKYLRLDSGGYAYTLTNDDFDSSSNTFTITDNQFLRDTSFENYKCGFDIIIYDYSKYDENETFDYNTIIKKYIFKSSDDKVLSLNTDIFGKTTAYDIVFWVTDANDIQRYGRHTLAKHDSQYSEFKISILPLNGVTSMSLYGASSSFPDDIDYDYEENAVQYTKFSSSGLSADENKNAFIDIYVAEGAENVKLYMNSTELNFSSSATVSNGWCKVTSKQKVSDTHYHISLEISNNLPVIGDSTSITTAKEFNRYSGDNTTYKACAVFETLLSGKSISTEARSVTFAADYDLGDKHISDSENLTQPGYIDNRRVPKAELQIRSDLNRIELSNQLKNGVMSNQFQFFIDVNISDFKQ